jgi:hypothetical protein
VRLSRREDELALEHYMCSYSTQGITLDATLRCRPASLTRSRLQCAPWARFGLREAASQPCAHGGRSPCLHSKRGVEHNPIRLMPATLVTAEFAHREAAACPVLESTEQSQPQTAQGYRMMCLKVSCCRPDLFTNTPAAGTCSTCERRKA